MQPFGRTRLTASESTNISLSMGDAGGTGKEPMVFPATMRLKIFHSAEYRMASLALKGSAACRFLVSAQENLSAEGCKQRRRRRDKREVMHFCISYPTTTADDQRLGLKMEEEGRRAKNMQLFFGVENFGSRWQQYFRKETCLLHTLGRFWIWRHGFWSNAVSVARTNEMSWVVLEYPGDAGLSGTCNQELDSKNHNAKI